jgi:hypothetical protein
MPSASIVAAAMKTTATSHHPKLESARFVWCFGSLIGTFLSSPHGAPKFLHKADTVIDRADGNSDEHGEDEAVEEVAERVADQV